MPFLFSRIFLIFLNSKGRWSSDTLHNDHLRLHHINNHVRKAYVESAISPGVGVCVPDDGDHLAVRVDGADLLLGAGAVLLGVRVVPEEVHVLGDEHPGRYPRHVEPVKEVLKCVIATDFIVHVWYPDL